MREVLGIFVLCLLLTGCGSKNTYKTITAEEAKKMMNEDSIILDVRTEAEYEISHIENAINIPLDTIDESVKEVLKDQNQIILVYCQSGNRSKQASEKLVDLGYTKIYNFGGLNSWNDETVSPRKDNTELLLGQILQAIKMTYLNESLETNVTLPFIVKCDGKTCTYGDNQTLSLSGSLIPSGTFTLGVDGTIEETKGILLGGLSCSIDSEEEIICE